MRVRSFVLTFSVFACSEAPSIEPTIVELSPVAEGYEAQIGGRVVDRDELDEAVLVALMAANPDLTVDELRREAPVFIFPGEGVTQEETRNAVESLQAFERVAFVAEERR